MKMINYLSSKPINLYAVEKYLSISKMEQKYTNGGPVKRLLEQKLEQLLHLDASKKVLCVCNGTAAMQAVMFLCKKNGITKWALPSYTFPAAVVGNIFDVTVMDISKKTYTLDLNKIKNFHGIIITNLFGTCKDVEKITNFCLENNLTLIFDNAASPLSTYKGINICNFGDYCIGSLHHTKYLGYGEGGFIICNKNEYEILTDISNFGFPNYTENMQFASNYKMSDVAAAFILARISNFNISKYMEIQNKMISTIGEKHIFNYSSGVFYNSLPVLFEKPIKKKYFLDNDIVVNKYYQPILKNKNSTHLYNRMINLPLHEELNDTEIDRIANLVLVKFK